MFRAPSDQAKLEKYREAGIKRVLLEIPDLDRDGILKHLDTLTPMAKA